MGLSRSGTLFLIGLLVLIALSLHPVASVEAVVDAVFLPSRYLAETTRPLTWIRAGEVRAAVDAGLAAAASERETSRAILLASQAAALPRDPRLVEDRALISAHVVDRPEKRRDHVVLRFPPDAGVVVGLPVVHGDVYVGRVVDVNPRRPGECTAELVTAKEYRVGAAVMDGARTGHLIVGGLLGGAKGVHGAGGLRLLVHYPDDRALASGAVIVSERAATSDARLADGFKLGTLETAIVQGVAIPVVRPEIDYAFGLDHVAIVGPPQMATAGPVLALDPFAEDAWFDARVVVSGDASPLTDTRRLAPSPRDRARVGAAVAIGARLLGRVSRVAAAGTDVRLVSDPGVTFNALLEVADLPRPLPLGRIVSRGVVDAGAIEFALPAAAAAALPSGASLTARVWTAGGEPEVPPGLLVGTATIERDGAEVHLYVAPAQDGGRAPWMRVWRGLMSVEGDEP